MNPLLNHLQNRRALDYSPQGPKRRLPLEKLFLRNPNLTDRRILPGNVGAVDSNTPPVFPSACLLSWSLSSGSLGVFAENPAANGVLLDHKFTVETWLYFCQGKLFTLVSRKAKRNVHGCGKAVLSFHVNQQREAPFLTPPRILKPSQFSPAIHKKALLWGTLGFAMNVPRLIGHGFRLRTSVIVSQIPAMGLTNPQQKNEKLSLATKQPKPGLLTIRS